MSVDRTTSVDDTREYACTINRILLYRLWSRAPDDQWWNSRFSLQKPGGGFSRDCGFFVCVWKVFFSFHFISILRRTSIPRPCCFVNIISRDVEWNVSGTLGHRVKNVSTRCFRFQISIIAEYRPYCCRIRVVFESKHNYIFIFSFFFHRVLTYIFRGVILK